MTTLYPAGYARGLVTLDQLKTFARADLMEPEYKQRLFAWIASRGGNIGIGSSFRTTQPNRPGFAPDGRSFHQMQTFNDGRKGFMAVDLVHRNGSNVHRAPRWDEVPAQGTRHPDISNYGVHCNVSGEPWHMQAIEVDGWESWVNNGRKHPNPNFPIKGGGGSEPPPTLKLTSPTMKGPHVILAQTILRNEGFSISIDGVFGRQTRDRVIAFQKRHGLTADGVVGPRTWAVLIKVA